MSGGSYDYLYRSLDGLGRRRSDIERMARRLQAGGYTTPAEATIEVLQLLAEARRVAESLANVWQAVEWADSGDWDEDQVAQAAADLERGLVPADHTVPSEEDPSGQFFGWVNAAEFKRIFGGKGDRP